jgi:hypothetical protein
MCGRHSRNRWRASSTCHPVVHCVLITQLKRCWIVKEGDVCHATWLYTSTKPFHVPHALVVLTATVHYHWVTVSGVTRSSSPSVTLVPTVQDMRTGPHADSTRSVSSKPKKIVRLNTHHESAPRRRVGGGRRVVGAARQTAAPRQGRTYQQGMFQLLHLAGCAHVCAASG